MHVLPIPQLEGRYFRASRLRKEGQEVARNRATQNVKGMLAFAILHYDFPPVIDTARGPLHNQRGHESGVDILSLIIIVGAASGPKAAHIFSLYFFYSMLF